MLFKLMILALFFLDTIEAGQESRQSRFKASSCALEKNLFPDAKFSDKAAKSIMGIRGRMDCAVNCMTEEFCLAFTFYENTGNCSLYDGYLDPIKFPQEENDICLAMVIISFKYSNDIIAFL